MAQVTALGLKRFFTKISDDPYDLLNWIKVDAGIINPLTNAVVFEQKQVEYPDSWSLNAINIVSQKYFWGELGTKNRESSLKQLINRVVDTITHHGLSEGYFSNTEEADTFKSELKYILASQRASFNSPVWFNIGAPERAQQASACFILSVEDTMESILNWYTEEGMIFKGGSGAGINLSRIRSSAEILSTSGGKASGPVSFMRGADASAGTIKSGGKTRRAAKMVILNADHPDIEEFIWCKVLEERKARVLEEAGFDMSLNGKDAISIQYQNANNSVRANDEFMKAIENDEEWELKGIKSKQVVKKLKARDLLHQIAASSWECADPGMQFDTTINKWNTTPNAGRINASNPCSEYMHLDNSACNLASLNLLKFLDDKGIFDVDAFKHVVEIIFTAQEILVGYSSYPTKSIGENALKFREIGIGYANLGALLMAKGLPYDSDEGRAVAAAITALMSGHAYSTSTKIAKRIGPFVGYNNDKDGVLKVLNMHKNAIEQIDASLVPEDLLTAAATSWDDAVEQARLHGVRNSQVSVLAPTGTIGLMMDCDTTGIEPDLGLVKIKNLVGGGNMSIVNKTVPRALKELGYDPDQIEAIVKYIDSEKSIIGAPYFKDKHYAVFACSMGENAIHYYGHIKMMGAVQPFLSGAISKTVNMPESVSIEDIEQLYVDAWKLGLKAVAIYRDNCKVAQPLNLEKKLTVEEVDQSTEDEENDGFVLRGAIRRELSKRRNSQTYEFKISDFKGFFTVGEFEDGTPGELFVTVAKQGSTLAGVMDAFARSVSYGLQYGVPLKAYAKGMIHLTFAPSGVTDDNEIKVSSSIMDYIFRRLAIDYLTFDDRLELGLASIDQIDSNEQTSLLDNAVVNSTSKIVNDSPTDTDLNDTLNHSIENHDSLVNDELASQKPKNIGDFNAPLCSNCGNQMQRSGSCYVCIACGNTTGCS